MLMRIVNKYKSMPEGGKAALIYTVATLLSRGLAIITMPIFTRILSPAEMGVVNLYNSWYALLVPVMSLALTSGGFMVAMKEFSGNRSQYVSSVLSLILLSSSIFFIVYAIDYTWWNRLLGLSTELVIMLLLGGVLQSGFELWLSRNRYEYKYYTVGLISIASAILSSAISVIAVIYASEHGVASLGEIRIIYGNIIPYLISFIVVIYIFYQGRVLFNNLYWKFSLGLSLPLVINSFASQVLSVSDRVMIAKIISNEAVGIYGTLYSVSALSMIIWSAINTSFVPYLYENIHIPEKRNSIRYISSNLILVFGIAVFILSLIAPEIVMILATEEYYEAVYIMPPIVAGVYFISVSNMYSNMLLYHKHSEFIMVSSIVAAIANVMLNYITLARFGYVAAAYTTLLAYMVLAFIQAIVSNRIHEKITTTNSVYDDRFVLYVSIGTVLLCLLCINLYSYNFIRYSTIVILLVLSFVFKKNIINIFRFRRKDA